MTTKQDVNRIANDFELGRAQVARLISSLKSTRIFASSLTKKITVKSYSDIVSALDAVIDVLPSEKPQNEEDYYETLATFYGIGLVDDFDGFEFIKSVKLVRDAAEDWRNEHRVSRGNPIEPWVKLAIREIADFWVDQGRKFTRSTNRGEARDFVGALFETIGHDRPFPDRAMRDEIKRRADNTA